MESEASPALIEYGAHALLAAAEAALKRDLKAYLKAKEPNPLVVACIEGAIEHVRDADFAYYASFK